eukprot:SAG22_NODE_1984_length_3206_cov_2.186675_2_plen_117_part_00
MQPADNDLLNNGTVDNGGAYTMNYEYAPGDLVMIDNLAIGHKAAPQAHMPVSQQGLRILHRVTVKAMADFLPAFGLPPAVNIQGPNPLPAEAGKAPGVWIGGGIGFRWDENIHMQN